MRSNKFAELYIESDDEIVKDVHPNALLHPFFLKWDTKSYT